MITKDTSRKILLRVTLSPLLSGMRVGDNAVRLKNNLKAPINPDKVVIGGELKQVETIYDQGEDGLDLDDFTLITNQVKEKSIKQRPRSLHYYPKVVK